MTELKPCPFCGEIPDSDVIYPSSRITFLNELDIRKPIIHVGCVHCGIDISYRPDWNTRPAEDTKDKEIERLKAEVTRYRRALHNLKEDCQKRLYWENRCLERLFLHEVITHIDAELDFAPDNNMGNMEENKQKCE